ncbi:MAG: hypothetical protein ACI4QX_05075 [Lachnospiraceae bacterium]
MKMQRVAKHVPMFLRKGTEHFIVAIWQFYIELVAHTSKITIDGLELIDYNRMFGFWHEDSYCMQLVLRELQKCGRFAHVIVTQERRGDYIADMVQHYGSKAMRLPDGMQMRSFLKDLKEESKKENMILAAAMDGPSGPYRKPKRLLFLLAHEANKGIAFARFKKKGMLTMPWRWDKYRIPLPFSKMECKVDYFGEIEQSELRNFDEYAERRLSDAD